MVETFKKFDGDLYILKQCYTRKAEAKDIAKAHRNRKYGNKARVVPFGRGSYCVYIYPSIVFGKLITDIVK